MKYTFSYYKKVKAPVLVRRPWWNLFGQDAIEMREQWQRHVVADIPEDEAQLLMGRESSTAASRLIYRIVGEVTWVQLESEPWEGVYLDTTGVAANAGDDQRQELK